MDTEEQRLALIKEMSEEIWNDQVEKEIRYKTRWKRIRKDAAMKNYYERNK